MMLWWIWEMMRKFLILDVPCTPQEQIRYKADKKAAEKAAEERMRQKVSTLQGVALCSCCNLSLSEKHWRWWLKEAVKDMLATRSFAHWTRLGASCSVCCI